MYRLYRTSNTSAGLHQPTCVAMAASPRRKSVQSMCVSRLWACRWALQRCLRAAQNGSSFPSAPTNQLRTPVSTTW